MTSIKQFVNGQSEDKTLDAYVTVTLYNINSKEDWCNIEDYVNNIGDEIKKTTGKAR